MLERLLCDRFPNKKFSVSTPVMGRSFVHRGRRTLYMACAPLDTKKKIFAQGRHNNH